MIYALDEIILTYLYLNQTSTIILVLVLQQLVYESAVAPMLCLTDRNGITLGVYL